MAKLIYPLKQVLEVKQKRVDDAEKVVKEKLEALEKEKTKLAEKEADRDKVKLHKQAKLQQLRDTLDHDTTSNKIQQMKNYLKVVDEKLYFEEKKVEEQKKQVTIAEENLEKARQELKIKRQEVDKLLMHKKQWEKEAKFEIQKKEEAELDELGSMMHSFKHKE